MKMLLLKPLHVAFLVGLDGASKKTSVEFKSFVGDGFEFRCCSWCEMALSNQQMVGWKSATC